MTNDIIPSIAQPDADMHAVSRTKLELFDNLCAQSPRDDNGFLTYFLDHTLIPKDFSDRPQLHQKTIVENAKIPLSMIEGYLSFEGVKPVWEQLAHETDHNYDAFHTFLNLPERDLSKVIEALPSLNAATIRELYSFYYWKDRSRACDLLRPVAAARLRDQRVLATEDAQFRVSSQLLTQLSRELEQRATDMEGRPFQGMTSQNLLDSMVKMMGMQRTALRLPVQGARSDEAAHQTREFTSPEQRIKQVAQEHHGARREDTSADALKKQITKLISSNEEDATKLQEAIINAVMNARDNEKDGANEG